MFPNVHKRSEERHLALTLNAVAGMATVLLDEDVTPEDIIAWENDASGLPFRVVTALCTIYRVKLDMLAFIAAEAQEADE